MYHLYGFFSQHTMKPLYVLDALADECGTAFEFHFVDLIKGEHKTEAFDKLTPVGKVPVLEHKGMTLFESGAICRYVADSEYSALFPQDKAKRAQVDQWMEFFASHPGRWLNTIYFEKIIKPSAGWGESNQASIDEAIKFLHQQLPVVDKHLANTRWLANNTLSIADLTALAYIEQCGPIGFPLADYAHIKEWLDRMEALPSVARTRGRL